MDEEGLLTELKRVREKGVARTLPADVPALAAAAGETTSLEDFLLTASEQLDPFDVEGVRIALGIGGLGRNSADRRADFANHYQRTAETVRRRDGIEDQVFRKLARVILRVVRETGGAVSDAQARASSPAMSDRVHIGRAPEVGSGYQRRGFDDEIDRLWADGGDRRVWLRGQPGLGKSYTARRIAQEANDSLVIWVESAGADAARAAFSQAAERMPYLGLGAEAGDPDRVHKQSENLLRAFESSGWSWLVILDNADIKALLDERLVPTGRNANGRVLVTAVGEDARMSHHGRIVRASLFTDAEAGAYLRTRVDARDGRRAALSGAPAADLSQLAEAVGHHPLALSTASATITANHQTVAEWIAEFEQAPQMDEAADEPDTGGYPHAVGRTFQLALEKASTGLPEGVVQRAAAIAAVQDADGHPTWLWARKAVRSWVAGEGELVVRHGRPVVVELLIAHGLVEVVGDAWTGGRLAMHQLAARAVREAFPAEELAGLGVILTLAWLANLVTDDAFLGPNVAALLDNTDLEETPARIAAGGLSMFARVLERDSDDSSYWKGQLGRRLADYSAVEGVLSHLGPTSKRLIAAQLEQIALSFRKLGDADQAIHHADRAIALYEEVVADLAIAEVDRADALVKLCIWYEAKGLNEEAMARREAAADRYEFLLQSAGTPAERFDWVTRLGELAEALGDRERALQVRTSFASAAALLAHTPRDAYDGLTHGARLQRLAAMQQLLGRRDDAEQALARSAEVYREFWHDDNARNADLARLALVAAAGRWTEAELLIMHLVDTPGREDARTLADDLMRLASVRAHSSEPERAVEAVARAIEIYRASVAQDATDDTEVNEDEDLSGRGIRHLQFLGDIERSEGRLDEAEQIFARALDLLQQRASGEVGELEEEVGELEEELGDGYARLGITTWQLGRYHEAADHLANAVRIRETLIALTPGAAAHRKLRESLLILTSAQNQVGETVKATETFRRRVAVQRMIVEADPADADAQIELAADIDMLAAHVAHNGDGTEAIELLESSLRLRGALAELVGTDAARVALATTLGLLGDRLAESGRGDDADAAWSEQLRILETRADGAELADALLSQGSRLQEADDDRAIPLFERATRELEAVVAAAPDDRKRTIQLVGARLILAMLLEQQGDLERPHIEFAAALELSARVSIADPGDLNLQALTAMAHAGLAEWLCGNDRFGDSVPHFIAAVDTLQLLLDLQFDMRGLAQRLSSTLRGYRDVLRTLDRVNEADNVSSRIDALERDYPDLDVPDVD